MVTITFRHLGTLLVVLVTWVVVAGCGPRHPAATYPVSGQVRFADGEPLTTGGVILFKSYATEDQPAFDYRGAIEADRTFRLSTFEEGDGAVGC